MKNVWTACTKLKMFRQFYNKNFMKICQNTQNFVCFREMKNAFLFQP
jgi:hypothetical protein